MADSTSGKLTLPDFEKDKTYLLTGETLQAIIDVIRENKLVLTGNVQFSEIGPEGSKLAFEMLPLACCIDGVAQLRTFVVLGSGTPPAA